MHDRALFETTKLLWRRASVQALIRSSTILCIMTKEFGLGWEFTFTDTPMFIFSGSMIEVTICLDRNYQTPAGKIDT